MVEIAPVKYKKLLNEGSFYDITFIVGQKQQKRIKAHKCILSISSPVFHSMFTGQFSEGRSLQGNEVRITDIGASQFKSFLEYIYTEKVLIHEQNWAPLLYAAEKYDIPQLKKLCQSFVDDKCKAKTVCQFYNEAIQNQVLSFVPSIKTKMEHDSKKVLNSNSFLKIRSNLVLKDLLSLDKLDCDEITVYRAALDWASVQIKDKEEPSGLKIREVLGPALYSIRLPFVSPDEFMNEVVPKGILNEEELIAIMRSKIPGKESMLTPFPSQSRQKCVSRFNSDINTEEHFYVEYDDDHVSLYRDQYDYDFNGYGYDYDYDYRRSKYDDYKTASQHSIKFKANKRVRIFGIGIFRPINNGSRFKGKINLKSSKDANQILVESSLEIGYDQIDKISIIDFKNSITVEANVWLIASLNLESSNIYAWKGSEGQTDRTVDGVQWTFANSSSSNYPTDVNKGQFPCIKFCILE